MREDRAAVDMHVQFELLFEQSTYLGPCIVVSMHSGVRGGVIQYDMAPQIIWLGTHVIVATTYFLSNHPPNDHLRYELLHGAFHQKTTLPLSDIPMVMTSDKFQSFSSSLVCGFRAGPWDFNPKLFTETSRNSAGTYCCTF